MTTTSKLPNPRLLVGICLAAFATLLFEIALIRVLSYSIWYHFAYVVLSTALLGYGASGTLLAIRPSIGRANLRQTLTVCCAAAAVTCGLALGFASLFPLDPMLITKDMGQLFLLLAYQVVATVPFFFSGLAVTLLLRDAAKRVDRLYFWDLLGAGLGCAAAVPLMNAVSPPASALIAGAVFAAAAGVFAPNRRILFGVLAVAGVLGAASRFGSDIPFTLAKSKHFNESMAEKYEKPVFTRWTALFRTDVLQRADDAPFDFFDHWGTSRNVKGPIQNPWGIITHDGTAGTAVYDIREGMLGFLDEHILALPYWVLKPKPRVLVIGVGAGRDVIAAARFGPESITGVELDPTTISLLRNELEPLSAGLFRNVELVPGDGRHFVKRSRQEFDLIQMTGVDTLAATSSGAYVLAENYLYTVEATHDYLDRLAPHGVLSIAIGHWDPERPRAAARILNVARRALSERGVTDFGRHVALVDSRHLFAGLLVKNEPFEPGQLEDIAQRSRRLGFQPLLAGSDTHPLYEKLIGPDGIERDAALANMDFEVEAITDDRPFFFNFYRWGDLLDAEDTAPVHNTALGQIVLAVLLVSLSTLGALVVLLPLVAWRRRRTFARTRPTVGILGYFLALGLGFMLFEISLMQRFVVYLGHPTHSLSVVLFSLLVFLGVGSFVSRRFVGDEKRVLPAAVGVIAVLAFAYMHALPSIQAATLGAALSARVAITVAALAPLGVTLGLFFPLGVRRAESIHRDLVPWAWAINGCASVTATVLAVVLAMSFGFEWVWLVSLAIYAFGVASFLWLTAAPCGSTST